MSRARRLGPAAAVSCFAFVLAAPLVASPPRANLKQAEAVAQRALQEGDVRGLLAAVEAAAKTPSRGAVDLLVSVYAQAEELPSDRLLPEDRFHLYSIASTTLSRMEGSGVAKAIERSARKHRLPMARFLALTAASARGDVDGFKLAIEAAEKDKDPRVLQRAFEILARSKERDAIEPLIDGMARIEPKIFKRGTPGGREFATWERAWLTARDALDGLTGRSLALSDEFRAFYKTHGKDIDPANPKREKGSKVTASFFGLEITGRNIVFIIDVSGSMVAIDAAPAGSRRRSGPKTAVRGKKTREISGPDPNRSRIERAKRELERAIRALPDDRRMNIISFSSSVKPWKETLVPVSKDTRAEAIRFVQGLKPGGITVTDYAIDRALADPLVDTVYLLTDGAPTHQGSIGPALPPDAKKIIDRIYERVGALNYRRGVRIHTLGFQGAEEAFLVKLAQDHNGEYVRIR